MSALTFTERMAGYVSFAETDFNQAFLDGRRAGRGCAFTLRIEVPDVDAFLADERMEARATGTLVCEELGAPLRVDRGVFNLFVDATGRRDVRMRYRLFAEDREGRRLTLVGFKTIADSPGFDVWTDTTTLCVRLLAGHVERDGDGAADVVACGILRVSLPGFVALLASMRVRGGSPAQRARALHAFGVAFAGRLWRVYGRSPLPGDLPDFPDADDARDVRWDGEEPGAWHETPLLPGVVRRIVPFTAGDGAELTLHNVRAREDDTGRVPVLLLHGVGVRANLFYGAPGRPSLVRALVDAGFDVWLANWRASIDLPPRPFTLDEAALYDHPAAIRAVLHHTGAPALRVLCHCQGSTSFVITALAGLAGGVERVVSSAVSLHPVVPRMSKVKLTAMVPVIGMGTPWVSAQWGARPPSPLAGGVAAWSRVLRRECDDPVCALSNYMYGVGPDVLWVHDNLDPATHHFTSREFGYAPVRFLKQIGASVRAGHLVPAAGGPLPGLPASYVAQAPPDDVPWTFVAGSRNRLFTAESQRRTHAWFDRHQPGRHALRVIDGFGHLDLLFGRDSGRVVHPELVRALGPPG